MLALKLLLRNWRSGELKLLSISLMLAVAVVSGIAIFTDRLDTTLAAQSTSLLGADAVISGSLAHNPAWEQEAAHDGIKHTKAALFETMVYAGDTNALASVKAVSANYPLRGQLEISQIPFAMETRDIHVAKDIPAVGEVWIDSRLLPLLQIKLGDKLAVGEVELTVTQILIREPELFKLAPRLLMNMSDMAATKVVQPGSRVDYKWLLAAESVSKMADFVNKIKPQLDAHQKLTDGATMQESLGDFSKAGKQFLLLTTIIAVLLSGVAIAISARQFSDRHTNQVALMKSLGVSANRVRALYFGQLLLLGIVASLLGLACGEVIQRLVASSLQQIYKIALGQATILPYVLSFFSGIVCLTFFALPALWFLPGVPPLKILRRELAVNLPQVWVQAILALAAVLMLIIFFSGDLILAMIVAGGLMVVVIFSIAMALLLLRTSKYLSARLGGYWRLAFSGLQRRYWQSLMQIVVFSIAIMALLTMTILRSSLMEEWSAKIPKDAPNHFLVNIPAADVMDVKRLLDQENLKYEQFYPIVRGRVTLINGVMPDQAMRKKSRTLDNENDFTWTDTLAKGSTITSGQWWGQWKHSTTQLPGVSVGAETAKNIGLKVGDVLDFLIGGIEHKAEVASLRQFEESATTSSFAYIFEPGSLANLSPTYEASFYLVPEKKSFVNQLLRAHPTMAVYELDRFIAQMQAIIKQVTDGVMLVLWLTLLAGCLVLFSAVMSSIDSRKQETGLLRALGSPRQLILGSIWVEFSVLGLVAGTVAIVGAETILIGLQTLVMKTPVHAHYAYWVAAPFISAILLGVLGHVCCRDVVTTPPGLVLRGAN